MKKFRWIHEDIVLDFKVPMHIQELFDEAEELNLAA